MMNIIGILLVCTTFTGKLLRQSGIFMRDTWFDLVELLPDNPYPFVKTIAPTSAQPPPSIAFPPVTRTITRYTLAIAVPTSFQNVSSHTVEGFISGSYNEYIYANAFSEPSNYQIVKENVESWSLWVLSCAIALLCLSIWLYYFRGSLSALWSWMMQQKDRPHSDSAALSRLGISQPLTSFFPCQSCQSRARSDEDDPLAKAFLVMQAYLEDRENKIRELEAALTPVVKEKKQDDSKKERGSALNSDLRKSRWGSSNPQTQSQGQVDSVPVATPDDEPVVTEPSASPVVIEPSRLSNAAKKAATHLDGISEAPDQQEAGEEAVSVGTKPQGSPGSGTEKQPNVDSIPEATDDREAESMSPACSVDAEPQRSSDLGEKAQKVSDSISVAADEQERGRKTTSADSEPEGSSSLGEGAPGDSGVISVAADDQESSGATSSADPELERSCNLVEESRDNSASISAPSDKPQVTSEPSASPDATVPQRPDQVEETEADDELYTIESDYKSPFKHCQKCGSVVKKASNPGQLCDSCQNTDPRGPRSDVLNALNTDSHGSAPFDTVASDSHDDDMDSAPNVLTAADQDVDMPTPASLNEDTKIASELTGAEDQDAEMNASASLDVGTGIAPKSRDAAIITPASPDVDMEDPTEAQDAQTSTIDSPNVTMVDAGPQQPFPPPTSTRTSLSMSVQSFQRHSHNTSDAQTGDESNAGRAAGIGGLQRGVGSKSQPSLFSGIVEGADASGTTSDAGEDDDMLDASPPPSSDRSAETNGLFEPQGASHPGHALAPKKSNSVSKDSQLASMASHPTQYQDQALSKPMPPSLGFTLQSDEGFWKKPSHQAFVPNVSDTSRDQVKRFQRDAEVAANSFAASLFKPKANKVPGSDQHGVGSDFPPQQMSQPSIPSIGAGPVPSGQGNLFRFALNGSSGTMMSGGSRAKRQTRTARPQNNAARRSQPGPAATTPMPNHDKPKGIFTGNMSMRFVCKSCPKPCDGDLCHDCQSNKSDNTQVKPHTGAPSTGEASSQLSFNYTSLKGGASQPLYSSNALDGAVANASQAKANPFDAYRNLLEESKNVTNNPPYGTSQSRVPLSGALNSGEEGMQSKLGNPKKRADNDQLKLLCKSCGRKCRGTINAPNCKNPLCPENLIKADTGGWAGQNQPAVHQQGESSNASSSKANNLASQPVMPSTTLQQEEGQGDRSSDQIRDTESTQETALEKYQNSSAEGTSDMTGVDNAAQSAMIPDRLRQTQQAPRSKTPPASELSSQRSSSHFNPSSSKPRSAIQRQRPQSSPLIKKLPPPQLRKPSVPMNQSSIGQQGPSGSVNSNPIPSKMPALTARPQIPSKTAFVPLLGVRVGHGSCFLNQPASAAASTTFAGSSPAPAASDPRRCPHPGCNWSRHSEDTRCPNPDCDTPY